MASCINQLAMMIVQIVMNNLLKHYGALSVYGEYIPIAVSGIVMKVNQITFSIVIGLGQGAQPVISFNYGARKYSRVRAALRSAITVGAGACICAVPVVPAGDHRNLRQRRRRVFRVRREILPDIPVFHLAQLPTAYRFHVLYLYR